MAEPAQLSGPPVQKFEVLDSSRHSLLVRVTHWIYTLSFFGLVLSGLAIILAHPRLYWGETGAVGTPSLIDLPIPFIIGPSVRNRPYHFFFAWILVLTGLNYVAGSLITPHFRKDLLPAKADLRWNRMMSAVTDHVPWKPRAADAASTYNVVQRLTY